MNIKEISHWSELPVNVPVNVFVTDDVEVAKVAFEKKFGFACEVAYRLNNKWLMVMDPGYVLDGQPEESEA